ncbi:Lipocalin-like domain-containing protein, partial [Apodospora peruviana]
MKINSTEIIAALAGTYQLINVTSYHKPPSTPPGPSNWGPDPVGLLTYTREGYMSANQAATVPEWRPTNIVWPPKDNDSDADWALIGRHAMSYAGHFSINTSLPATTTHGQLLHGPLVVASMPYFVGQVQVRNYTVKEQDGETYLFVHAGNVSALMSEILWRRVAK